MTRKPTLRLEGEDVVLRIHAPNFVAFEKTYRDLDQLDEEAHAARILDLIDDGSESFQDIVEDTPFDDEYLLVHAIEMAQRCIHSALEKLNPALTVGWEWLDYNEYSTSGDLFDDIAERLPIGAYPDRERLRYAIKAAVEGRYDEARANVAAGRAFA